jgi:probable phosphoglycerate mutase
VITAYFDGGARSNPGPAGYGVFIVDDQGTMLAELYEPLGIATNNVAEYRGLIAALQWAADRDLKQLIVKGDSQLIIEQMRGNYKVKHEGLKPLHLRARLLVMQIGDVRFEHVRREHNTEADRLSNLAMDANQTSA